MKIAGSSSPPFYVPHPNFWNGNNPEGRSTLERGNPWFLRGLKRGNPLRRKVYMTSEIEELRTQIQQLKYGLYALAVGLFLTFGWMEMKTNAMDLRLRGIFPDPTEETPIPIRPEKPIEIIPLGRLIGK